VLRACGQVRYRIQRSDSRGRIVPALVGRRGSPTAPAQLQGRRCSRVAGAPGSPVLAARRKRRCHCRVGPGSALQVLRRTHPAQPRPVAQTSWQARTPLVPVKLTQAFPQASRGCAPERWRAAARPGRPPHSGLLRLPSTASGSAAKGVSSRSCRGRAYTRSGTAKSSRRRPARATRLPLTPAAARSVAAPTRTPCAVIAAGLLMPGVGGRERPTGVSSSRADARSGAGLPTKRSWGRHPEGGVRAAGPAWIRASPSGRL
jgi:hypothetical protein